jgi:Zn-dependent protease with chaperone function
MKRLKLLTLWVVFPLLLAAAGGWQYQRAIEEVRDLAEFDATLQDALPKVRQISERTPAAIVTIGDQKMGALVALSKLQAAQQDVDTNLALARPRPWLALAVIVFGALAAVLGALALIATQAAGKLARRSRDALLRVFSLGRTLLPFVLVSHVSLTALAVAAALTYETLAIWHMGKMSSGEFKGMFFIGLTGLACCYTVWQMIGQLRLMRQMFENSAMEVLGRVVSESEAPGLWTHVRALAAKLGALPPDHIVVGMVDGFYVTAADVEVQPANTRLRGRTLHVPLIHLALLDRDEASAVIGHELGHFAGADTDYSMRFVPIYDGVGRSLHAVGMTIATSDWLQGMIMRPAFLFSLFFREAFDHAVNHWSREREIAADAAGARAAGQAAASTALVRTAATAAPISDSLDDLLEDPSRSPDDLLAEVLRDLAATPLTIPAGLLDAAIPHPSDSHPPTMSRIEALGLPLDAVVRTGVRPVDADAALRSLDDYFADAPALRREVGADLKTRVVAHNTDFVEMLESHAAAVHGTCTLHEGARGRGVVLMVMGAFFLAIALGLFTAPWWLPEGDVQMVLYLATPVSAMLAAFALWFLVRGWMFVANARQPALIMTPDTLWFSNSREPLPIAHLADFQLITFQGVVIQFTLAPEAPLPQFDRRKTGMPGARLFAKKRMIELKMAKACVDGVVLKPDALLQTVAAYFNAGQARNALHARKAVTRPIEL